jgi:hypothetical protein
MTVTARTVSHRFRKKNIPFLSSSTKSRESFSKGVQASSRDENCPSLYQI